MKIGILVVAYNAASTLAHGARPSPRGVPARDRRDARPGRPLHRRHLPRRPRLPAAGHRPPAHDRPPRREPRLRRQPEGRLPVRRSSTAGTSSSCCTATASTRRSSCRRWSRRSVRGEADAVFGSRMMEPGAARKGGMPLYKYVGNRILTTFQNAVAGTELSEWHSGYRAYRVDALTAIPFERNSDGFNFDTQIILQLHDAGPTDRRDPDPDVLRRRDLLRERAQVRQGHHQGHAPPPARQGRVRRGRPRPRRRRRRTPSSRAATARTPGSSSGWPSGRRAGCSTSAARRAGWRRRCASRATR